MEEIDLNTKEQEEQARKEVALFEKQAEDIRTNEKENKEKEKKEKEEERKTILKEEKERQIFIKNIEKLKEKMDEENGGL